MNLYKADPFDHLASRLSTPHADTMSSSFYSHTKCVDLAGASIGDSSMDDDMDGDYTRSYQVYVDNNPISDFHGSAYDGDIYVTVDGLADEHRIHIQKEGAWILWDPRVILEVVMVDLVAYAAPCAAQGVKYVTTVEEASQMPAQIPWEIPALADLVAIDIKYPGDLKSRKRSLPADTGSPPRKRSRTKQTMADDVNIQEVGMDSDRGEGPSHKVDGGAANRRKQKTRAAPTRSRRIPRNDVAAAMQDMEIDDIPVKDGGNGKARENVEQVTDVEMEIGAPIPEDPTIPSAMASSNITTFTAEPRVEDNGENDDDDALHNGG